jgi:hypothetical protein
MVRQPISSHDPPQDFDHHVVLFPTRPATLTPTRTVTFAPFHPATLTPTRSPAQPAGRLVTGVRTRIRTHLIRQVVVIGVCGRLLDVVEDLDQTIQLALAEGPRGVVCDLSAVLEGAEPGAAELLATAGRHARDWPGVPVAVASPDPRVREALRAQPLGEHLIVTTSLFSALSSVLATPALTVERLRLAAHPTAPRASREFVTRTLLKWQLGRVLAFASLVVSELVASSAVDAGTDIEVSAVWNLGALRLTVRDHGPALQGQPPASLDLRGRNLTVVAGLSRAFGVLPTADGGRLVWAVLDAPRTLSSSNTDLSATARQGALILEHARSRATSQVSAASPRMPTRHPGRIRRRRASGAGRGPHLVPVKDLAPWHSSEPPGGTLPVVN